MWNHVLLVDGKSSPMKREYFYSKRAVVSNNKINGLCGQQFSVCAQ